MLDFEQQANQAQQALASLEEDWHIFEDVKMRLEEDLVIRRSRPTMISAKYRAREERRRLLKISAGKLRRIEDPEASLCRSVLINNAVRRLQRENRDEKTRNYGLPIVNYLDDSSKENNLSGNLMLGTMDTDNTSKKRLGDEMRINENPSPKRQRHDDLDLQDDVFSDFYIIPSTPSRYLSESQTDHSLNNYHDNRLDNRTSSSSSSSSLFTTTNDMDTQMTIGNRSTDQMNNHLMDVNDLGCDRICDFSRFADTAKTLEERLVELHSLDEHFDLTKFERNNNQSCGRAFHDIQTFHNLVPGLET
ncbi:hypothetical protein HCN44_002231 [Aphidius gifuensis]|uniref:SERTA domain-containing protein n=1 Tax=Aphidius gifuensis TaxID=684658 RepID=A0A834XZL2_APHGI|nr:uncharacterized protein LOC122860617 isoform X1 [Aphidius gifuensis]KAF7996585.1 hypothetical protein HCN44_002231 [Aphidius gifuensis]